MPFPRRLAAAPLLALLIAPVAVWVGGTPPASAAAAADVFCGQRPATESPSSAPLESYEPINPLRIVDTRNGTGGVGAPLGASCTLQLDLSTSIVPASAEAVALSVTAVSDVGGFFTVYPCATGRPATSNVNARAGVPTPNLVVAMLDDARLVCIFSDQQSNIVIDLAGWWGNGPDRFASIDPLRVYDTRELPNPQRLPAGHVRNVEVTGDIVPADATAAVVNLTVTKALSDGWLVAYPCGNKVPFASNLNFLREEDRAVAAIVGLGTSGSASGQLCVQASADVHFIVDVVGYYAPASGFGLAATLSPHRGDRLLDTRDGSGGPMRRFAPGEIRRIDPVIAHSMSDEAAAVLLNVIAVKPSARGYLRVYPCTSDEPTSSSLNFGVLENASNLVPVELSSAREICIYAHTATDVVVDLFGVMAAPDDSLVERLSFSGMGVWPPYTPTGSDYGVRCGAGTAALDITIDTLPFASARVDGIAVEDGVEHRVDAVNGDIVTVELLRRSERSVHHFRCLPADFPDLAVEAEGTSSPGWYLTTFGQSSLDPTVGQYTVILDDRGAPIWYKGNDQPLIDAKVTPDGDISVTTIGRFFGTDGDDLSRRVYDLDGDLLDDFRDPGPCPDPTGCYPADHHDFIHLPGGGGAFVSYPLRRDVDLSDLGSGFFEDDSVLDGAIREIDGDGSLLWSWRTNEHFAEDVSTFPQRFGRYPTEPHASEVDTVHINSIDRVDDGTGDYVVSARHFDTVFRIDYPSGDVLWTLGPVTSPGAQQLTIVGDPLGGTLRQHDARLAGDVLTMFDNRTASLTGAARAVAYRIDTSAGTATMLWERRHPAGLVSNGLGSVRTASDGSVLIDWGTPLQPMFEELDAAGERLLAISQVPGGSSYRIVKYPATTFDRDTLRSQAGGDLEVPATAGP